MPRAFFANRDWVSAADCYSPALLDHAFSLYPPARAMKLALVRRGYSPTGGAEAYLKRFARALADAGHEPVLYTSAEWPAEEWPFELHRLREGGSPLAFARELESLAPRKSCDLVFSLERLLACDCFRAGDGVHAAWLARRARYEPFWKPLFRRFQAKHREIVALERAMLRDRGARAVIVNSRLVAGEINAHYGYPSERLHLVYNGVPAPMPLEIQARLRGEVRRELGLAENAYTVLFAGSGWDRKGLADAIHAANRAASHPTLLVAGSGSRRRMPASERTRYLGPVPGLARILAAADAFILPTRYDPFSNACLEALAAGVPVITTNANGVAEILTPETGSAVPDPVGIDALAQAIDLWSDPQRRDPTRIRAHAAPFTVERNLAETLRVLESLA